jgi:hypothetical protein
MVMIDQLSDFSSNVVAFRCTGRVTRADYATVLLPAILSALRTHRKVRLYYETGPDFALDVGAIWDDFKIGVEHLTRWERIAVVSDLDWIKKAVRLFAFLMPATTRLFSPTDSPQARAWVSE